jgi:hypothetical protein
MPWRLEISKLSAINEALEAIIDHQKIKITNLEDAIASNKTKFATEVSKLSITSHAVYRYRERCKGKGSDDDIYKLLMKYLVQQLHITDKLSDGKYTLSKGVTGQVVNNTLVTVLPNRDIGRPKLK